MCSVLSSTGVFHLVKCFGLDEIDGLVDGACVIAERTVQGAAQLAAGVVLVRKGEVRIVQRARRIERAVQIARRPVAVQDACVRQIAFDVAEVQIRRGLVHCRVQRHVVAVLGGAVQVQIQILDLIEIRRLLLRLLILFGFDYLEARKNRIS